MIIAQMMGNLGNQLFIYAMARKLQMEYGDPIVFDLGGLKRFYYSASYKLDHLNLPSTGISCDYKNIPRQKRIKYFCCTKLFHLQTRINRKIRKEREVSDQCTRKWFNKGCYFTLSQHYFKFPHTEKKDKIVYGYFQNLDYFRECEETIKQECLVTDPFDEYDSEIIPHIQGCNSVAVSMRAINEFGVSFIDFDFYFMAMKKIANMVENPKFFVFSDDIEATKKLDFPFEVEFITPADSCHGLRIMYNCKHFIIANSTFSWWGAYLAKNEKKIIIMPDKINKGGTGREGYYLDGAIKLPCTFVDYKIDLDQIIHQKYAK